ncbi:DUF3017 domain-containing protein [Streptomyces sp. NPDC049837]|uniref:DUF3017 domain-containing protein n=1 Tax=Streptomyces sp. NPDC049837 TaxID=3155277 RepID=UPI00342950E0
MGVRANDDSATAAGTPAPATGGPAEETAARAAADGSSPDPGAAADRPATAPAGAPTPAGDAPGAPDARPTTDATGRSGTTAATGSGREESRAAAAGRPRAGATAPAEAPAPGAGRTAPGARASRRPPTVTRDTARPEGGGRAAPGDAPAPARQWPLLTVLGLTALGLLVVGFDPFPQAPRIGAMLIGVALLTGAAMRRALPSVGMLAVRSRFTDMAAYGLLGAAIVLLSLMTQPDPWLEIPFLEDAVRFAVR